MFLKEAVLFPFRNFFLPQVFLSPVLFLEADQQLVMINSTVLLHCKDPQHLGLSFGHHCINHHRHDGILWASCSFHILNDDITDSRSFHVLNDDVTDGVWNAQRFHFKTQERVI
ncbi:hypothetical protein PoB_001767700 [Plakobranchus ocellatus]|uniref:Galectin n=1 Tax=Plakobranchus ocellatus TaxID=259542 RepID=A0AAV3Z7E6_9GAST|nr:hypothetical protein PoB_001767700 [Plakobranchus ocellatus]